MTLVNRIEKPTRVKKNGHAFGCNCRSCIGSRNRRKGQDKQRKAAKAVGIKSRRHGDMGNEETFPRTGLGAYFRFESKSGKLPKFITNAIAQAERAGAVGDPRPSGLLLTTEGSNTPYALVPAAALFQAFTAEGPSRSFNARQLLRKIAVLAKETEGLL